MEIILIGIALFLAFGNGANDNFKGFATVWPRCRCWPAPPNASRPAC